MYNYFKFLSFKQSIYIGQNDHSFFIEYWVFRSSEYNVLQFKLHCQIQSIHVWCFSGIRLATAVGGSIIKNTRLYII